MNKPQHASRGIPVWGARLKELRKRRGWTQHDLANHSGYCERLIRKAELNGSVSEETLEVLAMTLSDEQLKVSIDSLSLSSRVTASVLDEAIFNSTASSIERLSEHVHPQVTIDCNQVDGRLPLSSMFHRQRGLVDWYTILSCFTASGRVLFSERVLLDNARFAYIHASGDYHSQSSASVSFDLDIRVHFKKCLIHRIVWLSKLESLAPFANEWDQLVKSQYQQQIKKFCQAEYAQYSA